MGKKKPMFFRHGMNLFLQHTIADTGAGEEDLQTSTTTLV